MSCMHPSGIRCQECIQWNEGGAEWAAGYACGLSEAARVELEIRKREAKVIAEFLRAKARMDHPVEAGERLLSPENRGLALLWADEIERGEYQTR